MVTSLFKLKIRRGSAEPSVSPTFAVNGMLNKNDLKKNYKNIPLDTIF